MILEEACFLYSAFSMTGSYPNPSFTGLSYGPVSKIGGLLETKVERYAT
jgi:hypothetical protein